MAIYEKKNTLYVIGEIRKYMGIEKVVSKVVKGTIRGATVPKGTTSVASKVLPAFEKTGDLISKLPKEAYAHNYTRETIEAIEKYRKNLYGQNGRYGKTGGCQPDRSGSGSGETGGH